MAQCGDWPMIGQRHCGENGICTWECAMYQTISYCTNFYVIINKPGKKHEKKGENFPPAFTHSDFPFTTSLSLTLTTDFCSSKYV